MGIEAAAAEITPEGFIILGNMTISRDSVVTVVIKTDHYGNQIGNIHYYQGGSGNAIKVLPNNQGYLIVGERIKTNPNATPTDNIDISSTHMLHISNDLDSLKTFYLKDESNNVVKKDFKGSSLTITPDDKILILGTVQNSLLDPIRPYLHVLSSNLQTTEWYQEYDMIDRSYRNTKSIHYTNQRVIWASAIAQEEQNFDFSYISVPFITYGSSFANNSLYGETTIEQSFSPNDIQPSRSSGFGVVGTRSNSDGTNANILFFQINSLGFIVESSIRYFDAIGSSQNEVVNESNSLIQDYGTAITATSDYGFVLAGHYATTPQKGYGLNDILLIKIDVSGGTQWIKTLGGTGSETVSTIRETADGGLLLCGTNIVGAVPSIFLIKTDKNGELKN